MESDEILIPLDEARSIIRDGASKPWPTVRAAYSINRCQDSTFEDLLACLRRGGYFAEIGALGLYSRTGRKQASTDIHDLVTDYDDWYAYLRKHGDVA